MTKNSIYDECSPFSIGAVLRHKQQRMETEYDLVNGQNSGFIHTREPDMTRAISTIAREIVTDWRPVNYGAKPYLQAMHWLTSVNDTYGCDSGRSVVAYFLANAQTWRGEVARRVKKELNGLLKGA